MLQEKGLTRQYTKCYTLMSESRPRLWNSANFNFQQQNLAWAQWTREETFFIQLFGERLSEKVHATIPKGIVGGWFWVHFSSKKFKRLAREAMDICLRVLKESNKSRFDSYSVRNSVLIISHITLRDCRAHIFSDNLSRNSCISLLYLQFHELYFFPWLARIAWLVSWQIVRPPWPLIHY